MGGRVEGKGREHGRLLVEEGSRLEIVGVSAG